MPDTGARYMQKRLVPAGGPVVYVAGVCAIHVMSVINFLNILSEVGQEKTIIFSTHIVGDIVDLCQNFAILYGGKILCYMSPTAALAAIKGQVWQKPIAKDELEHYNKTHKVLSARLAMGRTFVRVHSTDSLADGFEKAEASLEDFYFSKTKGYMQ